MRICVTGHTSGIGRALAEALASRGNDVVGLSRSTGYDLAKPADVDRMVLASIGCRGFINNAHHGYSQVELLFALHRAHGNDPGFTVVTIGSNAADGIRMRPQPYAVEKIALDHAVAQLQKSGRWNLIHVRPGWVDTPRVGEFSVRKLMVDDVVEAVMWAMDRPDHVMVRGITIEPREA
jgi:nucleoside-diphosphate-sugar epimerase